MRLLTEVAAQTAGARDLVAEFDPLKALGIPSAIAAGVGLVTTFVIGTIRPLRIKKPRYWHAGTTTQFSCVVRNRIFQGDRTLTGITVIAAPGWVKRTFWPFWKRNAQQATLIPWKVSGLNTKIGKRDEVSVSGELRKDGKDGLFDPGSRSRLLAHAGSKSSGTRRLKKVTGSGA